LVLNNSTNSQFTNADDFRVDVFSISSYSSANDVYSVLAHGFVSNLTVAATLQPIGRLEGGFDTNGVWQAWFFARSNWLYRLERTTDFSSWAPVSPAVRGANSAMSLSDTNAVIGKAFYRVQAQ